MRRSLAVVISLLVLICVGCECKRKPLPWQTVEGLPVVTAQYSSTPVKLDGVLDDPVWQQSKMYTLCLPEDKVESGEVLTQDGHVWFAWDDDSFYVACKFEDWDIQAHGTEDHEHHYRMGDLCEVFLRPSYEAYYWEMYVTPKQHKTCFFFPMRASDIKPDKEMGLTVAAKVSGTLNDSSDRDRYWTGEMRISRKDLGKYGYSFGPGSDPWQVLIGRYNYLGDPANAKKELSVYPRLPITRYHLVEKHAKIEFMK